LGLAWLVVAVAVLPVCPAGAQEKKTPRAAAGREEASIWMTRKLEHTQKVLAGLTRGDFALIKKHAQAMQVLSYLEQWDRADLPEYRRQLRYFDEANKELIRHANNKNLQGATIAYSLLTVSCVHCHNVVRDAKK
jgi:hypothetical protein